MVIKLYIDYMSQPARAVLALCIIANIPYEVVETSIMKMQNRSEEFTKINPMKRVPAIVDTQNGLCLAESHSILKYLAQKYNVSESWYPRQDLVKQAKINEFLDFHHSATRKCSYLYFHIAIAPVLKIGDPTFNKDYTYKVVRSSLKSFQSIYLKDNKFIGGQLPCIGDLIAFFDITMLEVLDFDYSKYPKIVRWIAEVRKIEGVQKANQNFQKGIVMVKQLLQQKPSL